LFRARTSLVAVAVVAVTGLSACATSSHNQGSGGPIEVAASTNVWGSILAQLGGTRVHETSIVSNPNTDPHDYEPTPADGRAIAAAKLFVLNGIGYDSWARKAIAANPDSSRTTLDVGQLVGIGEGGNPHQWYSPSSVEKVADALTAALKKVDPASGSYFNQQRDAFDTNALAKYHQVINDINAKYAGTSVGATESIVAPLTDALGLNLITPASFLRAISEGTDPSASDRQIINAQISAKQPKVYLFNSQNATPDVAAQISAARKAGIPVLAWTETLSPANATFQDWQYAQLKALQDALGQATGR